MKEFKSLLYIILQAVMYNPQLHVIEGILKKYRGQDTGQPSQPNSHVEKVMLRHILVGFRLPIKVIWECRILFGDVLATSLYNIGLTMMFYM